MNEKFILLGELLRPKKRKSAAEVIKKEFPLKVGKDESKLFFELLSSFIEQWPFLSLKFM